jgi:hypothetical protein
MDKSLKYLVGISAVIIAGCAAYFSITGLGILFAGASVSVMVMAGSLEYAKLVTATYLKQKWTTIKGFNKWYLTSAVVILMAITSAGIFGYLSNAFQQQNIKLDQVQREIDVWNNKIKTDTTQITQLTTQISEFNKNQGKILDGGKVNSRLIRSIDNRDKEISKINKKISVLNDSVMSYNGHINDIKNNNIELEREVGGFRFVAEAFGASLNSVVKFFIFLIVIVFDPLAIALVIAFNQLVLGENKKEEEEVKEDKTKEIIEEESRLKLSEEDLKILESVLMNPPPPNDNIKEAAKTYNEQVEKKQAFEEMLVKPQPTQEERHELLAEIMKNDQELGLYDEPFDNPMIKENKIDLKEVAEKLKDRELFTESNQRAKEIIENSVWDETLMDGLEDEEPFFTEEEIENIIDKEPTTEEEQENFSTLTPEPIVEKPLTEEDGWTPEYEEQYWEEEEVDYPPVDLEPKLTFEEGQLPDDMLQVLDEVQIETVIEEPKKIEIPEDEERMNIIGQNGNEGLHYENEETTSSEQDDEKKN